MDRNSQFFTVMQNRICEQTDLPGFFDPDGYGMPVSPSFYRSCRIDNRPTDRPVKTDRVGNSANSFAARTARHGRNPHSSGIFTFFSFEEGSNFVQNIRQKRKTISPQAGWFLSSGVLMKACFHKCIWTRKQREAFGFSLLNHSHTGITRSFASSNRATGELTRSFASSNPLPRPNNRNTFIINELRLFI